MRVPEVDETNWVGLALRKRREKRDYAPHDDASTVWVYVRQMLSDKRASHRLTY